jgi:hypothetical protein
LAKGNRDRRFVRQRQVRTHGRGFDCHGVVSDSICPDRASDILRLLRAEIGEGHRHLCPDLIPHGARDANPARLRKSFQAGRDINGVTEEIVLLNDNVADVHPDAEPHLLTGRSIRILFGHGVLHRDSTLHSIHGAGEISDKAIASRVENPASMRGDQAIDDDPVSRERAKGADLISPHQAAIAFDIRCEDRR